MSRFSVRMWVAIWATCGAVACSGGRTPTAPPAASSPASNPSDTLSVAAAAAAHPPFNLEAILRGEGFGLVKFRQEKNPTANIVTLAVWVRDLAPNSSYTLQRAVDTNLDGVCTGSNWLNLGQGPDAQAIVTNDRGTGRADLWRDLSAFAPGAAFDIYFRIIEADTTNVVLESECYRFVVRD